MTLLTLSDPYYYPIFDSGVLSRANGRLVVNGNQASWIPSRQDWQNIVNSGLQEKIFVIKSLDKNKTGPYWSDRFSFSATP